MLCAIVRRGSRYTKFALAALLCAVVFVLRLPAAVRVQIGPSVATDEAAFFAFDLDSVPFRRNLQLTMVPAQKHPEPVVRRGPEGSPDELRAEFYGSVIKINGKYRMWYCGIGFKEAGKRNLENVVSRVCYAESTNGIHWIKPNLGLVEFRGNRNNNIVSIASVPDWPPDRNVHVLYEPEDPDPARRYKMMLHVPHEGGRWTMVPLFSSDGLNWRYARPADLTTGREPQFKLSSIAMPNEHLEGGGLVKFDGIYYQNGQSENPYNGSKTGRIVAGYWSPDFIHWNPEKAESFVRSGFDPKMRPGEGREAHEGAALWNRGNVLIGIYGIWEGAPAWNKRRIDLGLVTSVNAIHFREPVPDFVFVKAGEAGAWDANGLLQGQGFEQVGDETYIWYGSWDLQAAGNKPTSDATSILGEIGDIGLLKLRRDGFGHVSILDPKKARANETFRTGIGSLMTVPFEITGSSARGGKSGTGCRRPGQL